MHRFRPEDIEVPDEGSAWITRTATDAQKLRLMAALYRGHLDRVRAAVEHDCPDLTPAARRVEVAARVSGGDPDVIAAARFALGGERGTE